MFGNDGEILFHAKDNFAYRVRDDGTGLAKALEKPILAIRSISADKKWLVVADSNISIYPLSGGESIHLPGDFMLNWSPDSLLLYVSWPQEGLSTGAGVTYVIPLRKGEMIPQVFRDGIRSKQDLANLPGVEVIDAADVAPGPEPQVYAYSREVTQRNLFRIPIP